MDNEMKNNTAKLMAAAASNGHDRLVESLLLSRDVDVNQSDRRGRTPLFMAASKGHERVVELLLGREDVQVSLPPCEATFEQRSRKNLLLPLTYF